MGKCILSVHILLLLVSLAVIVWWFINQDITKYTAHIDVDSYYGYNKTYITGETKGSSLNDAGTTLLNLWTVLGHIIVIIFLQLWSRNNANDGIDRAMIFLLQQSLVMQLIYFLTLNWIHAYVYFPFPEYSDNYISLFQGTTAVRPFLSFSMAQLLFIILYIMVSIFFKYRAASRPNPGTPHITIYAAGSIFFIVNLVVVIYYPPYPVHSNFIISPIILASIIIPIYIMKIILMRLQWVNTDISTLKGASVWCIISSLNSVGIVYYMSNFISILNTSDELVNCYDDDACYCLEWNTCFVIAKQINNSITKRIPWLSVLSLGPLTGAAVLLIRQPHFRQGFVRYCNYIEDSIKTAFLENCCRLSPDQKPLLNADVQNPPRRYLEEDQPDVKKQQNQQDDNKQQLPREPRNHLKQQEPRFPDTEIRFNDNQDIGQQLGNEKTKDKNIQPFPEILIHNAHAPPTLPCPYQRTPQESTDVSSAIHAKKCLILDDPKREEVKVCTRDISTQMNKSFNSTDNSSQTEHTDVPYTNSSTQTDGDIVGDFQS